MKLTITTSITKEIDVPVPSFYKGGYEYRGIFSETDYREVWECNGQLMLESAPVKDKAHAIGMAVENWEQISELEFITRMDEALAAFSLTPKLQS